MRLAHLSVAAILLMLSCLAGAVEPAIPMTIERSGDALILDTIIDFPVPVSIAWDVLTDFDHMVGMLSSLTMSTVTAHTGNTWRVEQAGVAKFGLFSYAFASEREITLDPMHRIQARQLSGNAKQFSSDLELTPIPGGSQAHYHAIVIPDSGLAQAFGAPFIKHQAEEQFTALTAAMVAKTKQHETSEP